MATTVVVATVVEPIAAVLDDLAAPRHLGDWLVGVLGMEAGAGAAFALTLHLDGEACPATGELVA